MKIKNVKKATIFVVDDDPINLSLLFDYLGDFGFAILSAENGERALKLIKNRKPDLILLDIMMPGLDGFETCRRLKKDDDTRDIPVIFMSALSDTVDKIKGFEVGAVDYITKPFQWEEILARVNVHLDLQNLKKSLQEKNAHLQQEIAERARAEKRIEGLNRLKEDLLSPGSLDEKLKRITDGVVAIFEADFSRIWITKPGGQCDSDCFHARVMAGPHVCRYRDRCLHLMASSGRYTHLDGEVHGRVPFDCYKIGRIAAGKDPKFVTDDVTHDPHVHDPDWAKELGLVSFAGYRLLLAAGEPIGVLALFSKHIISPDEDALLEGLANTTTQVIQTARAEESLKVSEAKYQDLYDNAPDMFASIEAATGKVLQCNQTLIAATGYAREEIVGCHIFERYHPDCMADVKKVFQLFKETGEVHDVELQLKRKDGRKIEVSLSVSAVRDEEGHILYSRSIWRDITERKRVEETLRVSEEQVRLLLYSTAEAIYSLDMQGRCTFFNPACLKLLGYKKATDLLGQNMHALIHHSYADGTPYPAEDCRICFSKGKPIHVEDEVFWAADGTSFPVEYWAHPMVRANKIVGTVVTFLNITERKQAQEQLQQYAAELKEANTELSQYAYVVSHDLKAPLRAIHNYAHFLREDLADSLDGDQKMYLDGLNRATQEAEELVEDLLTLSRIGRQDVPTEEIDPGAFLQSLIASLDLPAEVEVVMAKEWPTLKTEPVLLRQVFQNLILNGLKFNHSTPKRIELGWDPPKSPLLGGTEGGQLLGGTKGGEGTGYEFFVRDNGIGIAPRYQEQIFRVFERLHTKEEYEGAGIGLAIVKKAVGKLGGKVRVESKAGAGSTFFVSLPKTQQER